jgi:hypothetical protein
MHLLRFRDRPRTSLEPLPDGALVHLHRGHGFRESVRIGPNQWHWRVVHEDGSVDDLGIVPNLLTNGGRDLLAAGLGGVGFGVSSTIATASSATSLTATGTPFTTDAFKGWIVNAEESTNAPVWANIGSNTTSVLTVDAWKTGDDTAGTTPGATANYNVLPATRARYMALTENAGAPAATDTVLTGEITTGGCSRALATYAHTGGTATYTEQKTFSVTASFPAIHKGAMFTASNSTAAGILFYEAALNADANVINGDSLQVTATVTLSG